MTLCSAMCMKDTTSGVKQKVMRLGLCNGEGVKEKAIERRRREVQGDGSIGRPEFTPPMSKFK